jgi:probable selenium-dependent hydroxylase accessory protein YqeC
VSRLVERLDLGDRSCVAIVGAGGKSTILARLGRGLAATHARVVLTTTTRMSRDQAVDPVVWTADPAVVDEILEPGRPLFVGGRVEGHKVIGIAPEDVDRLVLETKVDHVVVEADGARMRSVKAPGPHEPVIPRSAVVVIVVASMRSVGHRIDEVAHRPERVAAVLGSDGSHILSAGDVARLLSDADGGMKGIPDGARAVIALMVGNDTERDAAGDVRAAIRLDSTISDVLILDA